MSRAVFAWHGIQKTHPMKGLIKNSVAVISEARGNCYHMQIIWLPCSHTAKKGAASSSVVGRQNFKDSPLETKAGQVQI